jgi:hypothetical protein
MAGNVVNIKVCNPLKLRSGLTGNYHAICHYSYNLPLCATDEIHICHIDYFIVTKTNRFSNRMTFKN